MDKQYDYNKIFHDSIKNQLQEKEIRDAEEVRIQERLKAEQAELDKAASAPPPMKDPKDFNTGDNIKELGRAVVGGGVDIYNSIVSLPKLLDKEFYKANDPDNPYSYSNPFMIKRKPITHTKWGGFVRGGIELAGGAVGTGKVLWGIKGLKGIAMAGKATRWGRVALGGVQGAAYDVISNQSQEANLARSLIDVKPQWEGILKPIATTETMSPAMKSMYNIGEGLGIGGFFDLAFEGMGLGIKSISKDYESAAKSIVGKPDPLTKAVKDSSKTDYDALTKQVESGAKGAYERSLYRKFKNKSTKLTTGTRVKAGDRSNYGTIVGFEKGKAKVRFVNPQTKKTAVVSFKPKDLTQVGDSKPIPSIEEWRISEKPWNKLDDAQRKGLMELYAGKKDISWGDKLDLTIRSRKQGQANKDLAIEQLEFDIATKNPRQNPAYNKGGDISENQALTTGTNPAKGVRDMIEIRNDPTQKYGSPEGSVTEANIRRAEYTAPGMMLNEVNSLAKALEESPAYRVLYEGANKKAIAEDLEIASRDLIQFLSDTGNSRLIDIPEKDLKSYIDSKVNNDATVIEGLPVLNKAQLNATDMILGQLLFEARDLAKASLSVAEEINPAAPGGMLDGILSRYSAIARTRKETSMASSYQLKMFSPGTKLDKKQVIGQASDAVASDISDFKSLLKNDLDDDLLETFIHFTATGNGNKQTFKDLDTFFKQKLKGYRTGDVYQKSALINELQTMGINSILSGPKTVARALVGTGIGTVMRPVATMVGAIGDINGQTFRSAAATLGGMVEARNEAWRKAVADFQSYNLDPEGFRGFTETKADMEWNAMMSYFDDNGTFSEKAIAHLSDNLRNLNKSPYLNYGPRTMKSMDTYFSQLIARGRQRQLAFDDVWGKLESQGKVISDQDMPTLLKEVELDFESKVFSSDGQITDEMAKFAADEAKLTKELTGNMKRLDTFFDQIPFLKPFFLFARTGVNALQMTSKYTPIVNSFIKEHTDLMTKSWDDPAMIQYGVKSLNDLNIAKATMKGRMAIGYGFTSMAMGLALNGKITGNGPPDRETRDSWAKTTGWQPRSFKVGDSYISYESLEPFNALLGLCADIVDSQRVMGEEWVGNWAGKTSYLISANVVNKSFMAGLLQLSDLLTSQGGDAPRALANFVNNQVPLSGLRNEVGKVLSPGMRELESGFWQSIGNRNLWADVFTEENILPYKYDILDGEPLRMYDPMTRLVNAVLPINLNIGTNSPTKELLMRSGLNLKQTFNTGPNGELLENRPDLKSKYQYYMSQANITGQVENILTPQIIESITKAETSKKDFNPRNTLHGQVILPIFETAKQSAWDKLKTDIEFSSEIQILEAVHDKGKLRDRLRKLGDYEEEEKLRQEVEAIQNIPK